MVWLQRLPTFLGATMITLSSYSICSGNDLLLFENEARRLYSRTVELCDTSFTSALIPLEDLARYIDEYTAQGNIPESRRDYYRNRWKLGDSTTVYSLHNSLIPKVRSLALAETNYLAAAGIVAHCDLNESSISDVVYKACLTGDFDLVTNILLSIDNESMFFDALFGLDSLPEDDRYYDADWRWEEDEYGDLPKMPSFNPMVTIENLSAIEAHGAKIVTEARRLEFYYGMLNLYLSFNFLHSANALVSLLEPYESSFFPQVDSAQIGSVAVTESFVWDVSEADWQGLARYHSALSEAYVRSGERDKMIRSIRMGLIAIDRGPYRSVIPPSYPGWFNCAIDNGVYSQVEDLAIKFCYETRYQSRIACIEADSGHFDLALEWVQSISDGFLRSGALEHIARRLHKAGNETGTKAVISLMLESALGESLEPKNIYSGSNYTLSSAAETFANMGFFDDAVYTAQLITDVGIQCTSLGHAAAKLRTSGRNQQADSIESAIVDALSAVPDSLLGGESAVLLLELLIKYNSPERAEALISPHPMIPYWQLIFEYGQSGDTASVERTLGRIHQQVEALRKCLDSCVATSDTTLAGLFAFVFKRAIRMSEVTHYLDEWSSPFSGALTAAARLGDSEFANWVVSQDQSPAVGYLATHCLAIVSANSGDTTKARERLDSAFVLLRKAAHDEDLRGLEFDHEATLLIQLENSTSGRLAAMRRLLKLSIEKNVSAAVCRIFSGFAKDDYRVVNEYDREEKRLLHEIIEIYARWYLLR